MKKATRARGWEVWIICGIPWFAIYVTSLHSRALAHNVGAKNTHNLIIIPIQILLFLLYISLRFALSFIQQTLLHDREAFLQSLNVYIIYNSIKRDVSLLRVSRSWYQRRPESLWRLTLDKHEADNFHTIFKVVKTFFFFLPEGWDEGSVKRLFLLFCFVLYTIQNQILIIFNVWLY